MVGCAIHYNMIKIKYNVQITEAILNNLYLKYYVLQYIVRGNTIIILLYKLCISYTFTILQKYTLKNLVWV